MMHFSPIKTLLILVTCLAGLLFAYLDPRDEVDSLAPGEPTEGVGTDEPNGPNDPGKGDLSIANNWVGERFDCLSMTIEMPFKDVALAEGFSPDRARSFGRSSLECVLEVVGALR